MLNKRIVGLPYFILVLAVCVIYRNIILHLFLDKNVTILVDNEHENSKEDSLCDSETDVTNHNDIFALLIVYFIQNSLPFSFLKSQIFHVNTFYNTRLQQQYPPP
jgi:hypothetical protein